MTGTSPTKRKVSGAVASSSSAADHGQMDNVVYDLVNKPHMSLLEKPDHVPVKIDGLTMVENKHICVCVTVAKTLPNGGQQPIRRELLKTEEFRKKWPQMLIRFYELQATVNKIKLPTD